MFMKVYRQKLIEEAYGKHPKSLKKLQNPQDKLFARNNWAQKKKTLRENFHCF